MHISIYYMYFTYGEYVKYMYAYLYIHLYLLKTWISIYNILNSFLPMCKKDFISHHLAWQMKTADGGIVYVI